MVDPSQNHIKRSNAANHPPPAPLRLMKSLLSAVGCIGLFGRDTPPFIFRLQMSGKSTPVLLESGRSEREEEFSDGVGSGAGRECGRTVSHIR
jgi:hypothetical protein